jgi:hypothetical protein
MAHLPLGSCGFATATDLRQFYLWLSIKINERGGGRSKSGIET